MTTRLEIHASACEAIQRINDMCVEDILESSDDEILQEAEEEGIDIEAEAERVRALIEQVIRQQKADAMVKAVAEETGLDIR